MKIVILETFKKDYRKLTKETQKQTDKQLELLVENPRHPSLRIKKLKGTQGIWELRISKGYRLTFHVENDTIILRRAGTHDLLNKEG